MENLERVLVQKMNIDEMTSLGDIPALNAGVFEMISQRKKMSESYSAPSLGFFDMLLGKYKVIALSFSLVGVLFVINFLCTFKVDASESKFAGMQSDTSLTVSSNTYLATLEQPTIAETPVITSTAMTSIYTFKN